jgi:GNAT superfamily N-acetyltransferase
MLELAEEKRRLYETYQPRLWRSSPNARSAQAAFFKMLISNISDSIVLVYEDAGVFHGFIIAKVTEAPPVYAPGGRTCLIDDFAVAQNDWNEAGRALLDQAYRLARAAGAVQGVVVCGHLDEAKHNFLLSDGFSIASEWFVTNL